MFGCTFLVLTIIEVHIVKYKMTGISVFSCECQENHHNDTFTYFYVQIGHVGSDDDDEEEGVPG